MIHESLRLWKTLSTEILLEYNPFLTVEKHHIQLPSGQEIHDWTLVKIPDAVIIPAITTNGEFLIFRQTKYAIPGLTLAPVGGMLNPGEDPLAAAQRELLEETGYTAPDWTPLGSFIADPNRGVCTIHLYLAQKAVFTQPANADDLEDQQLMKLTEQEVRQALLKGDFKAIMWTTAIALTLLHLDNPETSGMIKSGL
jgi:ADP-ribose pyrophosphatase